MRRFLSVSIWVLLGIAQSYAQSDRYQGVFPELFFGRQPSARSEAMGRSQVAVGGEVSSAYYNPAALASLQNPTVGGALASPYYFDEDARYDFYGAALPLGRFGVISLSRFFFDRSPPDITLGDAVVDVRDEMSLFSLGYALHLGRWVDLGINVNFFRRLVRTDDSEWDNRGWPVDVGLFKAYPRSGDATFRWGASLGNVNRAGIGFPKGQDALPSVLRLGVSYGRIFREGAGESSVSLLSLLTTLEYQNVLNGDKRTAWRAGLEAVIWEVLALRAGYYSESLDMNDEPDVSNRLSAFTYGAGLRIPVQALFGELPDWAFRFDYTYLPQPDVVADGYAWPRFTTVGFSLEIR